MEEITVRTHRQTEMIDITAAVQDAVRRTGVRQGVCTVFVPHTTAGITINENADPAVVHDILMEIEKLIPQRDGYAHAEGNSAAHIKSSLFGCSTAVIVEQGRLRLGTWQSIFFCEFDGPRTRSVWIQVTGDRGIVKGEK
ncbi:MAG: secondary thiamine-phosphate synthase enzyme YjbQ [Desulfobacterota bacterium]|nr:secondary thiamine-phosphate synthase enzyme YjbQ [Thermodesulfobacteriota bacterium]